MRRSVASAASAQTGWHLGTGCAALAAGCCPLPVARNNLLPQNSTAVVGSRAAWVVAAWRDKQTSAHLARHAHVVDTENASDDDMQLSFELAPGPSRHPTELTDGDGRVAVESVVALHEISLGRC